MKLCVELSIWVTLLFPSGKIYESAKCEHYTIAMNTKLWFMAVGIKWKKKKYKNK